MQKLKVLAWIFTVVALILSAIEIILIGQELNVSVEIILFASSISCWIVALSLHGYITSKKYKAKRQNSDQ